MKKTRLLNGLQSVFLVGVGLLVGLMGDPQRVAAETPFQDDFEAYSTGSIKGQGFWTSEYSGCVIQTTYKKTGAQALSCTGNTAYRIGGDPLATGTEWEFWVYNPSSGDHPDGRFTLIDGNGTTIGTISYLPSIGNVYALNGVSVVLGAAPHQTWTKLGFRWDRAAQTVGYGYNGAWTDYAAPPGFDQDVAELHFLEQNNKEIIIDDITGSPIIVSGYDPIVSPTTPPDGETTVVDLDDFSVVGSVEIPTDNPFVWTGLTINFDQVNGSRHYDTSFDMDIAAGESYSWNATTTADNLYAYKVSYVVSGYAPASGFLMLSDHYVPSTYITETASLLPEWEEVGNWDVPTLDDCDALSGLDKIVCEIKNVLLGMVVPSQDKLDSLVNSLAAFNNKFPMNYITEINEFFGDVQDGMDEDAAISFEIFGQAGTVSAAFWNSTATIGGTSQKLGDIFKSFITAFFVIAFFGWSINFLQRIF
jgi:hypothetical protein